MQTTLEGFIGSNICIIDDDDHDTGHSRRKKKYKDSRIIKGTYHIPVSAIGKETAQQHIDDLTFTPKSNGDFGTPPLPVSGGRIEKGELMVPRCYGISHFGTPNKEDGIPESRKDMLFKGNLKDSGGQKDAAASVLEALRDPNRRGATLVLPCGFGKTVVSLYVSSQMRMKTLILCHKSCLLEQWRERIQQYIPDAKIGLIQGNSVVTTDEYSFVLGMLQSVYSHDYPSGTLTGYGMLIVDEAHHVPASTFLTAVSKVGAHATLALTATPDRRDGLTNLLYAAMGNVEFKVERPPMEGTVEVRRLPCNPAIREKRLRGHDTVNLSKLITDLSSDDDRTKKIVDHVLALLDQDSPDRYIMILSDRTAQLREIQKQILNATHPAITSDEYGGVRLLIGSTKPKDRKGALSARVVLTTYPFSQEGVDKPRLDTLIMATPKGDTVQAIGRILREHSGKAPPLILDYTESVDSGVLHGLFAKRKRTYAHHGFDVLHL